MVIYVENLKELTEKILELIIYCSKVAEYMVNMQKSIAFLYTNNKQVKSEIKNIIYISTPQMKYIGINLSKYNIYMRKITKPW